LSWISSAAAKSIIAYQSGEAGLRAEPPAIGAEGSHHIVKTLSGLERSDKEKGRDLLAAF